MSTAPFTPLYDESLVPAYELPDPLLTASGRKIVTSEEWSTAQRGEILQLFRDFVYGNRPDDTVGFRVEEREFDAEAMDGLARRDQIRLRFGATSDAPFLDLLIYRPATAQPVPAFLSLNFRGNHATTDDPAVFLPEGFANVPEDQERTTFLEGIRGIQDSRFPYELLIQRGYALATFNYHDAAPDHADHWREGVARLFSGATGYPGPNEAGAIALWAWGLSRALDYLQSRQEIDGNRIALIGHSRQGKAALWAGAEDERFALVISNNSGSGGAAISRRKFGETVQRITSSFPHWFCGRFAEFGLREEDLPVDQHELLALVAPRPLYVASATEDLWADPKGEFLGAVGASPVYGLFGLKGLREDEQPAPDQPVGWDGQVAYHLRTGKHDLTQWDWERYVDFADLKLGKAAR
jgi:hypothetical protein